MHCGSGHGKLIVKGEERVEPVKKIDLTNLTIVMYHSPICRCCEKYEEYLESAGFKVEFIEIEKTRSLKKEIGIPKKMWSYRRLLLRRTQAHRGYTEAPVSTV